MSNKTFIYFLLLLTILLIFSFGVSSLLQKQNRSAKIEYFINIADEIWRTKSWPRSAYNPPMIIFIILGLRALGITPLNPYILNFCFLAVGVVGMYGTGCVLLEKRSYAFWSAVIGLLNPYFLWSAFLAKDVSAEFMFLSLLLWVGVYLFKLPENTFRQRKYQYGSIFLGSAACLGLSRVTGFLVVFSMLGLLVWHVSGDWKRRFFFVCSGLFLGFTLMFCFYNYLLVGKFTLATNGGVNLYLGNHPAYLHGHPKYDIDVFINWNFREVENTESPAGEHYHSFFLHKTVEMIKHDPLTFMYRIIQKSFWHWCNLEKIPHFSTKSTLYEQSASSWLARLDRRINILPSLAYLLYKLFYLPFFLISCLLLVYKKINVRYGVLYAPLLGLWPLVTLTFPDTRFKICAEVLVLPALFAAALQCRQLHQMLKNLQQHACPPEKHQK